MPVTLLCGQSWGWRLRRGRGWASSLWAHSAAGSPLPKRQLHKVKAQQVLRWPKAAALEMGLGKPPGTVACRGHTELDLNSGVLAPGPGHSGQPVLPPGAPQGVHGEGTGPGQGPDWAAMQPSRAHRAAPSRGGAQPCRHKGGTPCSHMSAQSHPEPHPCDSCTAPSYRGAHGGAREGSQGRGEKEGASG